MSADHNSAPRAGIDKLPRWLRLLGVWAASGTVVLSARLVYEQTFLTWHEGPQMVGFTLVHSGLIVPLFLSAVLLVLWIVVALVRTLLALVQRRKVALARWVAFALAVGAAVPIAVPYGTWPRLFADRLAAGPHAAEHLSFAAADGDLATVIALLGRGVNVNAKNSNETTGLYAAAVQGKVEAIEYLLSQGADVTVRNKLGQGILAVAREMHREEAVKLLQAHGVTE